MRDSLSRRELLAAGAAGAAGAVLLSGCDGAYARIARELGAGLPASFSVPDSESIDPDWHLLSRAAFGPRPGDLEHLRQLGRDAWIDEQLAPGTVDDSACALLARRHESLHLPAGDLFEFKRKVIVEELQRATLIRAIHSRRQLLEVMVEFWSDHLSIDQGKGDCAWLKTADDRDVIRRHALGNVRDLIRASATSPAMLVYLDGIANRRSNPDDVPNENYARELLELHTLGVHGGYTQEDVMEAARALTGWRISDEMGSRGKPEFVAERHDDGEKRLLGVTIPAGLGASDVDQVIDIVCSHPSTHRTIATKLCRRLVADAPPAKLIERTAATLRDSAGDIQAALRVVLSSDELEASMGVKLKRPFRFIVSALRALGATTARPARLVEYLRRLGHLPFSFPTPDGYPDEAAPWLGNFFWRWQLAMALTRGMKGIEIDGAALREGLGSEDPVELFPLLAGRLGTTGELAAFSTFRASAGNEQAARRELVGLMLASPAFQVH